MCITITNNINIFILYVLLDVTIQIKCYVNNTNDILDSNK